MFESRWRKYRNCAGSKDQDPGVGFSALQELYNVLLEAQSRCHCLYCSFPSGDVAPPPLWHQQSALLCWQRLLSPGAGRAPGQQMPKLRARKTKGNWARKQLGDVLVLGSILKGEEITTMDR